MDTTTQIQQLNNDVNDLQNNVNQLAININDFKKEINTQMLEVNTTISQLKTDIDISLADIENQINVQLNNLQTQIDNIDVDFTQINQQLTEQNTMINELWNQTGTNITNINNLQNQLNSTFVCLFGKKLYNLGPSFLDQWKWVTIKSSDIPDGQPITEGKFYNLTITGVGYEYNYSGGSGWMEVLHQTPLSSSIKVVFHTPILNGATFYLSP